MPYSHHVVVLVGMCGSGKSEVADQFVRAGYVYIRFGQITLDEIKKRGLEIREENEKIIREEFRKEYGMAAFAILNIPKIEEAIDKSNVIVDGLYSWSEYKALKEKYGDSLIVIAVYAPPRLRYVRLEARRDRYREDPKMKYRSFSREDAKARDYAEIENIEKAGPIAMADYTIVNEGAVEELTEKINRILRDIRISNI